MQSFTQIIKSIPKNSCGVYKLFNRDEELIYVGKSYNLRSRLKSTCRYNVMAEYLSYIIFNNELETDLQEAKLIQIYSPVFNKIISNKDSIKRQLDKVEIQYNFTDLILIDIEQIQNYSYFSIYKDLKTREIIKSIRIDVSDQDYQELSLIKIDREEIKFRSKKQKSEELKRYLNR